MYMELVWNQHTNVNSNIKNKRHQRIKNRNIKLHSNKINQPKLSRKVQHRDEILGEA